MKHQVKIHKDMCIGCGLCAKTCVAHNIEIKDKKAETILDACVMCGQCSAICPKKAITITGYDTKMVEKIEDVRLDPQTIVETIRFRRSIRQFQKKDVPKDTLIQILEAGRLTHTAKNKQDVSFVVLDKQKGDVEKMAVSLFKKIKPFANMVSPMNRQNKIHEHFFFFQAPIVIVILAKDKTNGLLAAQNMEFVAEANGLGVLYSGFFTTAANISRNIRKTLHVPKGKRVAMTLVMGYPSMRFLRAPQREALNVRYM